MEDSTGGDVAVLEDQVLEARAAAVQEGPQDMRSDPTVVAAPGQILNKKERCKMAGVLSFMI